MVYLPAPGKWLSSRSSSCGNTEDAEAGAAGQGGVWHEGGSSSSSQHTWVYGTRCWRQQQQQQQQHTTLLPREGGGRGSGGGGGPRSLWFGTLVLPYGLVPWSSLVIFPGSYITNIMAIIISGKSICRVDQGWTYKSKHTPTNRLFSGTVIQ